jgi:putative Ca2+/H+ antiporter (TMEM165/GDT1 family)
MFVGSLAFLFSAGAVALAEMGDKTQLLAMTFTCRFPAWKVLAGVFIATIFNHAIAVALGSIVGNIPGFQLWVQGIAAVSFLFFALWSIPNDTLDDEARKPSRFGPIMTVVIAFFLAEMGDKTQFAAIALSAKFPTKPLWVLAGTTTGMMISDAFGIIVVMVFRRKIPERALKLSAALLFTGLGLFGAWQVAHDILKLGVAFSAAIIGALGLATLVPGFFLVRKLLSKAAAENAFVCKPAADVCDSGEISGN